MPDCTVARSPHFTCITVDTIEQILVDLKIHPSFLCILCTTLAQY